ncbi:MAG: NAD(P)/FAD-dependent oxidoreductase [Janthinobacterium lividum]
MTIQSAPVRSSWLAVLASGSGSVLASAGNLLVPWLDLTMRVWLAQAFFRGAAMTAMTGSPLAMGGTGRFVAAFDAVVASPFGLLTQFVCPVMLLLGLGGRLAASLLLVQVLLLHGAGGFANVHITWSVLLAWTVIAGPGLYSLDALLATGLDSSALPGARSVGLGFSWITTRLGPLYWLALRLWIASLPLVRAATGFGVGDAAGAGPIAGWTGMPGWTGTLPPGVSLAVGLLLSLGFGTRCLSLVLIFAIPLGPSGMSADDRLYWMVLLGLLACRGPGVIALDALVARSVTALAGRMTSIDPTLPHVVILGGGFGGVAAARGLSRAPCRVTLVDRNNHHVFQPLLYQVATAGLAPTAIATPIRSLLRSQTNLKVLLAEVRGVSTDDACVILDQGRLPFDFLVIATGARHSYFGRDDWAEHAPGLKRIEDATHIRRRLLIGFERAEGASDHVERKAWMTFVIVGGGPTGVELAGAIAELARHGLTNEYRTIDPAGARVILVQSADRLLPTFPASLSAAAQDELHRLGVEVLTGAKVELIDAEGVVVGAERIEAGTVLWAAGVAASPAARWCGAKADKAGRIVVGPDLSVFPDGNIFAIGDTAASMAWNGSAVPGLAPAAKQGGIYVAAVIRAKLAGRSAPKPFRYRHAGSLATIGKRAAVADFGALRLRGAPAWWLWGAVHILFLAGGRNRASVILEWVWAYITDQRGSRLITTATGERDS